MSSKIEIYNIALNLLGMREVSSITEETPSVDALNTFYQPCLDELFSEFKWHFATVKEPLVLISDTTMELEWSYVYLRPTSAATVWSVYNASTADNKEEQEFEVVFQQPQNRRIIGSDLSDAYVEYTYKVADTTLFSPKFVMSLAYKLAASCAFTLVRDINIAKDLLTLYGSIADDAKVVSFAEKRKVVNLTSAYQKAR